jgi:YegS/Rv2252/BmrU family lipid kinase
MKILLIINPRSGRRKAGTIVERARQLAATLGHELHVKIIAAPGDGHRFAQEARQDGSERIICAGGDGTLNAVASGLIGCSIPLGIVPMGSGNGYVRSLALPRVPEKALLHAFEAAPRWMDICYLNDHPFLGTAGIGFDAQVAHKFDTSPGRGLTGYIKVIVREILYAPPMQVEIHVNGEVMNDKLLMLVFCNTREFGNGADISPGSRPDDGIAELRLVKKPALLPLIKAFIDIFTHRADHSPYVKNVTTTKAFVKQQGTWVHLDGEPIELGQELHFRLEPRRLLVVG